MPLVFLGALLCSLFLCSVIPLYIKSFLYAVSLSIKECLIFSLPFIIFALVFSAISKLGAKALKYVLIIMPLICISNFANTMLSYFSSSLFLGGINVSSFSETANSLTPCFEFSLKKIISNNFALVFGLVSGILLDILNKNIAFKLTSIFDNFTKYFFKILIPVMPFFVAGTAIKLQHEGILKSICEQYLPVLVVFIATAYTWVFIQFFMLAKLRTSKVAEYLKNIFPAIITALGSMSSLAALPFSIKAAEKNSKQKENAAIVIPASVNIHLVGDCFFIPMMAIAVMTSFGMEFPSFSQYIGFAFQFMLMKFAVAAIPGGGVLVMLPIMQTYLGLTSDMLALVTTLYFLFDPVITSCNVAGNGAFAIIFDKITQIRFSKK